MDITNANGARDFFGGADTSVDKSEVPARKEQKVRVRCCDCRKAFVVSIYAADTFDCPECGGVTEPR